MVRRLAAAQDAPSLAEAGLPNTLRDTLERAVTAYRKVWWERHSRSGRARIEEVQDLLNLWPFRLGEIHPHLPAGLAGRWFPYAGSRVLQLGPRPFAGRLAACDGQYLCTRRRVGKAGDHSARPCTSGATS